MISTDFLSFLWSAAWCIALFEASRQSSKPALVAVSISELALVIFLLSCPLIQYCAQAEIASLRLHPFVACGINYSYTSENFIDAFSQLEKAAPLIAFYIALFGSGSLSLVLVFKAFFLDLLERLMPAALGH
ncbi:MAG: hypothetical protein K2X27_05740 [Candidatus Obscuribacterales bacterium]|nr:hypothetical protein [Candidatus Obscuribacterales bacterium]